MTPAQREELLLSHGIRPTANRMLVAEALTEASRPLSLTELEAITDTIDKSGIFRTLTLFREQHLVHTIEDGEAVRYEICHSHHRDGKDDDLHPHFFCTECHRSYCLDGVEVPTVPLPKGFSAETVNYIIKGRCPSCSRIVTVILAFCLVLCGLIRPFEASAQAGLGREAIIARIAEGARPGESLSFQFTRIRRTSMAAKDLVSEGEMAFVAPDKLRWEITGPVKSLFVLNGQRVLTENARGRRITDLQTERRFQGIARNIAKAASGPLINERDFKIEVIESCDEWVLKMKPVQRELAGLFSEIILTAQAGTGIIQTIVLRDLNGDTTTLKIRDIRKGGRIADATFQF